MKYRSQLALLACALLTTQLSARAQSPQHMIADQVPKARQIVEDYHAQQLDQSSRTLHIVYWTPKDRPPADEYRQRLSRVMFDIQAFYRDQMQRLGFGPRTFGLASELDGLLKIHTVQGESEYRQYDVSSGNRIRRECMPTLRQAGINPDRETLVIFCNMSNWDPEARTINQNSPYYASGGLRSGTAWQVDSPILDARSLGAREPMLRDGQYGRISLGQYNSIFVGGVCHELGHALGLPHNRERPDEATAFGTALMGSGNRTYGNQLRQEGPGSFLTLGEGLRLAAHPLLTRSEKGIDLPAMATLEEVEIMPTPDDQAFVFTARVIADPPAYAVVGYMDPAGGSDYDATTTTAVPDSEGRFKLLCAALKKNSKAVLRVVVCQANGGRIDDKTFEVPYVVKADGKVDIAAYRSLLQLKTLGDAVAAQNAVLAEAELRKLKEKLPATNGQTSTEPLQVAQVLVDSLAGNPTVQPAVAKDKAVWLSELAWKQARVGWRSPLANRLPDESPLLRVGGELFARGLYAHAPSHYTYQLAGRWQRLTARAGLADGHAGSVVFVVEGDGRELYRSQRIEENQLVKLDVMLAGVDELSLRVEDAGDGNGADWGVWIDPQLER